MIPLIAVFFSRFFVTLGPKIVEDPMAKNAVLGPVKNLMKSLVPVSL